MLASLYISAQNGINSPYSRYGFGMQADRAMGFNKGMSGVAQGFRDGQIINPANPASFSAVDSLTALIDIGFTMQNGNFKIGQIQQNARNSSFDYAAFHFRTTKNLGIAFALLPYTNINYSLNSNSETVQGTSNITSSYVFSGSGGLHQALLGMGWRPFKPISIGVNGSFLFGDYTHTTTTNYSSESVNTTTRGYTADISTWMLDMGLQIIQPINSTDKVVLGATYGLGHDINNRAVRYTQSFNSINSVTEGTTGDTLQNAFQLPHSFSIGFTYYKGSNLQVGADFEMQKWSQCKFPSQDNTGIYAIAKNQLNDKIKVATGFSYTPNHLSTKTFQAASYKFGGYYSQSYANASVNGSADKPHEFGLSAGISIPLRTKYAGYYNTPKVNISFQWVHSNIPYITNSTTATMGKLNENYLKLSIGLTFNERWFYKWKAL